MNTTLLLLIFVPLVAILYIVFDRYYMDRSVAYFKKNSKIFMGIGVVMFVLLLFLNNNSYSVLVSTLVQVIGMSMVVSIVRWFRKKTDKNK